MDGDICSKLANVTAILASLSDRDSPTEVSAVISAALIELDEAGRQANTVLTLTGDAEFANGVAMIRGRLESMRMVLASGGVVTPPGGDA